MSTNYYFKYKSLDQESFNNIRDKYNEKYYKLFDEYKQEIIKEYNKKVVGTPLEQIEPDLTWVNKVQSFHTYEVDEIHLFKISSGWKPLFQTNENWSSVKELEDYYSKHKNILVFVDEYDEEQDFNKILKDVKNRYKDKNNQSHIKESTTYFPIFTDKEGYEFTNIEFS